jgi:hypothetical protein
MRNTLLAAVVTLAAALGGVLTVSGQASAEPSIAATTAQGFKNNAQNQCIGPRWWNANRYANLYSCNPSNPVFDQRWVYDNATLWDTQIRLYGESRCLTHTEPASFHILLAPCNANSSNQRWNHFGYDGSKFMLKNKATGECMEGWWNEWVEMVSCNGNAIRQWWSHVTP